jgi:hypothetical protein
MTEEGECNPRTPARRAKVLPAAGDDAARRGGVGRGEEEHLGFRVRVGVGRRKLAGD